MIPNKHIHTFFNINSKYTYIASICISSILSNLNKDYKISFYILSKDLKEEDKEKLQSLKHIKEYDIEFIDIDESVFTKKIESSQAHVSFEANYKFLLSSLKPNLDKCIYLDADLIATGDLAELWEVDIDEHYMAGVIEECKTKSLIYHRQNRLNIKKKNNYVNTGVMLCNLKKWREDDIEKKFFKTYLSNEGLLLFPDKDTINIVLQDRIKPLDKKYNCLISYIKENKKDVKNALKNSIIIHYSGEIKPWLYNIKYKNDIWLSYARKLPFYDEFVYKYTKLIDKECLKNDKEIFKNLYDLKPTFDKNYVSLCCVFDDNYVPYFSVLLRSIIDNSDTNTNYDIVILHNNNINTVHMKKLLSMISDLNNFSIRFVDIYLFANIVDFSKYLLHHWKAETYFRFFIPKLFKNYEKTLYIDADTIVLKDLKDLFDTNLEDKFLGVIQDTIITGHIKNFDFVSDVDINEYISNKLGLKDKAKYFGGGVLLFNIKKCSSVDFLGLCLEKLRELKKPIMVDQCVLNSLFADKTKILHTKYNLYQCEVYFKNLHTFLPKDVYDMYEEAKKDPVIIHYEFTEKPWTSIFIEKADIWWSYARKTPFYEEILYKNLSNPLKDGAKKQIQSHLSYKLGQEILSIKNNKAKIFILPFSLPCIYLIHFISKMLNSLLAFSNASIRPEPLHNYYSDYKEALKIKNNQLTYRLGNLLVKHPFTFLFRVSKVYKEWKREKSAK